VISEPRKAAPAKVAINTTAAASTLSDENMRPTPIVGARRVFPGFRSG
jgi:hypothetical protein